MYKGGNTLKILYDTQIKELEKINVNTKSLDYPRVF